MTSRSAEALCTNLPAYTSCLRSFCLLLETGGGPNCTAVLIDRCEDIVQTLGVQASSQTHPGKPPQANRSLHSSLLSCLLSQATSCHTQQAVMQGPTPRKKVTTGASWRSG